MSDALAKLFSEVFSPEELSQLRKDVEFGRISFITIREADDRQQGWGVDDARKPKK